MPSGIKKHGLNAPSALSAAIPPPPVADNAADTSLSPAFRNVLAPEAAMLIFLLRH